MSNTHRMPTLFVGHGSPLAAFENNQFTALWSRLGQALPRPRAIVCISAHWFTRGTGITGSDAPPTIHDFYGFPDALYEYHYRAKGDPVLAARVIEMLKPVEAVADTQWGYDHGSWTVLKHMYPQADIPLVQLSIDGAQPAQWHYELGQRLTPLRDEGVLIMGSGNVVHNLRYLRRDAGMNDAHPLGMKFNAEVRAALERRDDAAVIDYARYGDAARFAVPTPDHYLPLLYVLGASDAQETAHIMLDQIAIASISMMTVGFGIEVGHV
jgi:4,5-DOPA dioxygenase extradiol